MNYVLAHGIRTKGEGSIDRLAPLLREQGVGVHDCELPVRHTWSVRRTLEKDAELLGQCLSQTPQVKARSIIAHSHGCGIALMAAKTVQVSSIWLFNPAIATTYDVKHVRCDARRIYCIYSPSDWTVWLGSLIPRHPFGRAGQRGMRHIPAENNLESIGGHSEAFTYPRVQEWAKFIVGRDRA